MGDKTVSQEINILRKKIKDLEAQKEKTKRVNAITGRTIIILKG
jgi:hypothetical protein